MHTLARRLGVVVWPAFLGAAALETVVFAFVDPAALLSPAGGPLALSAGAVYSLGFFAFWVLSAGACGLTLLLGRSKSELDGVPRRALSGSER
ncbi:MAG TPA: hypothetical protein PLZ50_10715 [Rubrivivax sp.]|mgnify:FL=1|nr:hypothetical protein [Pseudomonadota bacterium]HOL37634.1 hypothetical protein [Rubrivivax sp.]HPP84012.1 hypothetical protein [Rubrivivax sp.]